MSLFFPLQTILIKDKTSAILPGETGATPLHYCAYKDRDECAKLLVR